ncbi:hypothetical protein BC835DRAFT_1306356 [Cytidiella melzeri]|nr:hypothetical protein BC835DRAFT_1306356 [Cytidiella melzeri]
MVFLQSTNVDEVENNKQSTARVYAEDKNKPIIERINGRGSKTLKEIEEESEERKAVDNARIQEKKAYCWSTLNPRGRIAVAVSVVQSARIAETAGLRFEHGVASSAGQKPCITGLCPWFGAGLFAHLLNGTGIAICELKAGHELKIVASEE